MTKSAAVTIALATALAGCATTGQNSQSANQPEKATSPSIDWNNQECVQKNLTLGTASNTLTGANIACIRLQFSATQPQQASAAVTSTGRKTKPKDAPVVAQKPTTAENVANSEITTAKLTAPACGSTSSTALSTVKDLGGRLLSGAGGLLERATGNAAAQAAGGGAVGNVLSRSTKGTTSGQAASATATIDKATAACNVQHDSLRVEFAKELPSLIKEYRDDKKVPKAYGISAQFESDLPPAQHARFLESVNAAIAAANKFAPK